MTDRVCHSLRFSFLSFILFLISLQTSLADSSNQNDQIIIESPLDQQAKIGDRALLKCKIKNLRGEPQWCIDDFCLGVLKKDTSVNVNQSSEDSFLHLKGRPRYRIVGDRSRGEFHLLVEPVQLQDNMYFYCMVTAASETIKAVKSKKVFLTVLTYPQSLSLENPVHVSLNKPSVIECKARQSRPPVKILISINGITITDESKYKTEIIQYPIFNHEDQSDSLVSEGSKKRFSYVSSVSSITVENLRQSYYDTVTNLTLDDITMRMHGQTVECFAYSLFNANTNTNHRQNSIKNHALTQNTNVMSTKSIIQVDYAPEVNLKIVSANHVLKEEDVISLVCDTKATPPIQSYKWYIGKSYLTGVSDSNLNLKLRKEMYMKTITCEASNTVASVKASIQLNILFKPSFVKGAKSYMLLDNYACNKPLTLDCQVNSNPSSNITWYRRRLSQAFLNRFYTNKKSNTKLNEPSLHYSLFGLGSRQTGINFDELKDIYEDELIGSGPTYTIASFNCANILENVKNKTKKSNLIKKQIKRFQRDKISEDEARHISSSTPLINDDVDRYLEEETENDSYPVDDLDYLDKLAPSSTNIANEYDETDYFYDYDENEGEIDEKQENNLLFESNDFGVYLCEASNRLSDNLKHEHLSYTNSLYLNYDKQVSRRFIKLNPIGAPILKVMPSTINSLSTDEMMSLMMKTSLTESYGSNHNSPMIEIAASIGSSVSLTCLIEPLPHLETIVWIKDNGRIIPNSRYSVTEGGRQSGVEDKKETDGLLSTLAPSRFRNFRVKHENLTVYNSKIASFASKDEEYLNSMINTQTSVLQNQNGVKTTDADSVVLTQSTLHVKRIRKQDFGVYKCKSSNSYGSRTSMILLRQKTLLDKFNLSNSHVSYIILILLISLLSILFMLTLICITSKRIRGKICCCSNSYSNKALREKKLLSNDLSCNISSDKKINEWLAASSKLTNSSLMHTVVSTNNSGSSTTTNILHDPLLVSSSSPCNINISNKSTSSKCSSKTVQTLTNSPHHELTANCSSLLDNDEEDDESTGSSGNKHKIDLTITNNSFQASQLARYLVSSPLMSTTSSSSAVQPKNDDLSLLNANQNAQTLKSTSSTKTAQLPPSMMMIRSHNFSNGNFNAKITTKTNGSNTPSLNDVNDQTRYLNTLQRHQQINNRVNYETPYRLSDLFNELTPNPVVNNTSTLTFTGSGSGSGSQSINSSTLNKRSGNTHQVPSSPSITSIPLNQSRLNSNKSSNPFNSGLSNGPRTNSFYTNFYRNQSQNQNEQYYNNQQCKHLNI